MNEQEFYKFLGEKIRKFRKEANMTLGEVCAKVGVYETDLSKFEKYGEKIRGAYTINEIILATGHTWKDLFKNGDTEEKKPRNYAYAPQY